MKKIDGARKSLPLALVLVAAGIVGASPALARPIHSARHFYHYSYGPNYTYAPSGIWGYPGPLYMYAPGGSWGYPDPVEIRGTVLDEEENPSNYRH